MYPLKISIIVISLFFFFQSYVFADGSCTAQIQPDGNVVITNNACSAGFAPFRDIVDGAATCSCVNQGPGNCSAQVQGESTVVTSNSCTTGYTPKTEVITHTAVCSCVQDVGGDATADDDPCSINSVCDTALGPLAATPGNFIRSVYVSILSMSGGIAVLLIIQSGYLMMVSQGNPEKVKDAQERLTAAIVGLLFIIFSFVILEVIGVDILGLPGLQK